MDLRATKFEFEQRFWMIGGIIGLGFGLAFIDHTNFAVGLLRVVAPGVDLDGEQGNDLLRAVFGFGALLLFLAASLRTWATAYLKTEIVHDTSQHSEALVADGPFRYVRNPLYLANLPVAAGLGVMASRLGWLFMVMGMWLFMYRLIFREESGLLSSQGDAYRGYLKAVPRLWPALTPRVPAGRARPRWGQAFAGESFIWIFAAALLCLAITLNIKAAGIVCAASFPVYFAGVYLAKKRASSASA